MGPPSCKVTQLDPQIEEQPNATEPRRVHTLPHTILYMQCDRNNIFQETTTLISFGAPSLAWQEPTPSSQFLHLTGS